jgi:excisionase family DNA binding protein
MIQTANPPPRPYAPPRAEQREPRPLPDMLTSEQVSNRLAISLRTLWRLVRAGKMPKPVRYNRKLVRWKTADVIAYVRDLPTS